VALANSQLTNLGVNQGPGGTSLKESSAFQKLNQKMKPKRNNAVTNGQIGSMIGGAQPA
jgi:hypothetical protein